MGEGLKRAVAAAKAMRLVVHFSGALRYVKDAGGPRETTVEMLRGYAACVTGPRAHSIRLAGNYSEAWASVTCKKCIRLGERAS